jgi:hypothetical protein
MASEEILEKGEQQATKKMASEEMELMELDHGDFAPVAPGRLWAGLDGGNAPI